MWGEGYLRCGWRSDHKPFPNSLFISQTKKGKPLDLGRGKGKRYKTISSLILGGEEQGAQELSQPSLPSSVSLLSWLPSKSGSQGTEVRQYGGAERGTRIGALRRRGDGGFLSILDS